MTVLRPETAVVSHLLTDHADLPAARKAAVDTTLLRALDLVPRQPDPDFAASVAAGYVETPEAFGTRIRNTDARKEG